TAGARAATGGDVAAPRRAARAGGGPTVADITFPVKRGWSPPVPYARWVTTGTDVTARGATRRTYLLVDGENVDATLGGSILGARPAPEGRPRWERVLEFARTAWGDGEVTGLFFLNASSGTMPMSFVQALLAIGFRPIPLA